jgi:glycosyltransferase involved in cell wall biosynthesis
MQYIGFIHRRALKYVDHFLSHPYKPNYQALKKLKVPDKKIAKVYFPIIIDTSIFKYNQDFKKDISEENFNKMKNFTFKIFHPSRLMIQRKKALIEAGQWKGNEMLLLGLRRFIDDYAVNDICIVLPDRVQSVDKEIFERIIKEQRLENNIVWVKGETDQGFNKREMVAFYSSSDLVVDEFGIGWFGSIVIEGAACSRPTMCYVDENATHKMYPWHPIISVNTPIDIAKEIARLYFDKDYSNKKGEESRSWAVEFHSQENAGIKYAAQIQSLLEESLS